MISMETFPEGFALGQDGRRTLVHSARRPCIEIGAAPGLGGTGRRPAGEGNVKFTRLKAFRIEESGADLAILDFEGRLRLTARSAGGKLRLSFSRYSDQFNRIKIRLAASPDESIFGCGERFGRLDLKGRRIQLWVEDRGSGRDICPIALPANLRRNSKRRRNSTYFPQPSFISTDNYWVHADAPSYCRFDFRNPRYTVLEFRQIPGEIVVGWGGTPTETVAGLSSHVGRPVLLPSWTSGGAIVGVQGGLPEIQRKLAAARDAGASVAAVWIQDWCGCRASRLGSQACWNWKADSSLYPNLADAVAAWKAEGIRFLGYINPFLAIEGELYAEAREKGYCVRTAEGADYIVSSGSVPFALVDLTNPRAIRWLKDCIRHEMIDIGMSGWLADFGEYLPEDAVLHNGERPVDLHNLWPVLWAKANREAIEEAGKGTEIVAFFRSGWEGSSRYASAFWAGAQYTDFDGSCGMASVLPAGLSAGISGAGFWHFDVGGCVSRRFSARRPECLKRWFEIAAFTPLFRTHEGCRPLANSQYWSDADCLRHFARMTEIFAALEPYHETVARECVEAGLPPLRHLWLHYGQDPSVRCIEHQYLYGRDILAAPVLRKGQTLKEVYLPQDRWVHFWSSRTFRGGSVILEAPLGYPPVFYREDSRFAPLFDSIRRNARKL